MAERLTSALAGAGFATLIGYQLYTMTRDPLSLAVLFFAGVFDGVSITSWARLKAASLPSGWVRRPQSRLAAWSRCW